MNKILLAIILSVSLAACGSNLKKDKTKGQNQEKINYESGEYSEDFDIIDSEKDAMEMNKQTQAEIEEVEVSDRVFFDLDSSELNSSAKGVLDNQVAWLKSDPSINVVVEGHCDERGAREYNLALGEKRAEKVRNYLINNGVSPSRVKTISYGKERPAFVGSGESIWSKNRRAVTVIQE